MRWLVCLAALPMVTGCALFPFAKSGCPEVTRATAWTDRMPRIGTSGAKLIVSLELADEEKWMLVPIAYEGGPELVLDLQAGGYSVPGTAVLHSKATSARQVQVMCEGRPLVRIGDIMVVQ